MILKFYIQGTQPNYWRIATDEESEVLEKALNDARSTDQSGYLYDDFEGKYSSYKVFIKAGWSDFKIQASPTGKYRMFRFVELPEHNGLTNYN